MPKTPRHRFALPLAVLAVLIASAFSAAVANAEPPLTLDTSGPDSSKVFSIEAPGEVLDISVDAGKGQWLEVIPSESTFQGALHILDPQGEEVTGSFVGGLESAHGPYLLAEDGTYTVVLTGGAEEATGSVRLTAALGPPPVAGEITPTRGGATQHVVLPSPGTAERFSVPIVAGETIAMTSTGETFNGAWRLRWVSPSGEVIDDHFEVADMSLRLQRFTEGGTYALEVLTEGWSWGSVDLHVHDATSPAGLTLDTSGTGSSKVFSVDAPGEVVEATLDAQEGQWLAISPSESTFSGSLHLVDPQGNSVNGTWGGLGAGAHGPVLLGESGTYRIVLHGGFGAQPGTNTGSVRLTAALGPPPSVGEITPTRKGATQHVTLPAPGSVQRYSVDVTAGEQVSTTSTGQTFNGAWRLRWVSPSGNALYDRWFVGDAPVHVQRFTEGGTYTLEVLTEGWSWGEADLHLYDVTPEVAGSITPLHTPQGATQHVAIGTPGETARYTVDVTAGEKVALKTTNSNFDGNYEIRWSNLEGQTLYSGTWAGTETWFWSPRTFRSAGTYLLEVDPEGAATGSVDLKLWNSTSPTGLTLDTSSPGSSKVFSVDAPGEVLNVKLDGTAGERLSIRPSEVGFSGRFSLLAPDGSTVAGSKGNLEEKHGPFELPETGSYTILLYGFGEEIGDVRLTAVPVGEDIVGELVPTTGGTTQSFHFESDEQTARYTVPVVAGESVSMVSSGTALGYQYRVEWRNPAGEVVRSFYPSGVTNRFFEAVRFEEAGDATLVVTPDGGTAGSVDLTFFDATDQTGRIASGETKAFSIPVPGRRDLIEFEGTEGTQLSLLPSEATFEGEFHLETPAGEWIEGSGGDLGKRHGPVPLTETGVYTIVLTGSGAQTGTVALEATELRDEDQTGTIVPLATPEGARQHVELAFPERNARYSVEVTAGEKVALRTTESTFFGSYQIRWLDPEGQTLYSESFGGEEDRFWPAETFAEAGTYTLEVDPDWETVGSVDLQLWEDPTLTGQELELSRGGDSTMSTVGIPGQVEAISFDGEVGHDVEITTSESSFDEGQLTLMAPAGYGLESGAVPGTMEVELYEDGTYTILVEDRGGSTGSAAIELRDLSSESLNGQIDPTPGGTVQHVEFTSPIQVARYKVPVTAGEGVSMISRETSPGAFYRIEWLDPTGEPFQGGFAQGDADHFFEAAHFHQNGMATLVVAPEAGAPGSFDLTVYDATDRTAQIAPGESANYSISIPGQRYLIGVEGVEGEQLELTSSEATLVGVIHVQSPAGEWLEGLGGDLPEPMGPVTLPETGTYTIYLEGLDGRTGSVTLAAGP